MINREVPTPSLWSSLWSSRSFNIAIGVCVACAALVLAFLPLALTARVATGTFRTTDLVVDNSAHVGNAFDVAFTKFTVDSSGDMLAEGTGEVDKDATFRATVHERYDNLPDSETNEIMRVIVPDTGPPRSATAGGIVGLSSGMHKRVDCTAQSSSVEALAISVDSSRSAGAFPLANIGIVTNISNGQTNLAFDDVAGDIVMENVANTATLGATTTVGLTNNTGAANFFTSSSITLNQHVSNFAVPDVAATGGQVSVGEANTNDGFQLELKNTLVGASISGELVNIDTAVAAGQRGGYLVCRGAGGGLGACGTMEGGVAVAAASGFPFVGMSANDMAVFVEGGGDLYLGANNSTFVPAMKIKSSNDSITLAPTYASATTFMAASVPSVNNGSLDAAANNYRGRVTAVGATSTTLTFGSGGFPYVAHCTTQVEGAGIISTGVDANPSATAPVFSCFTLATGVAANCPNFTYRCD